ncbi:MAG TPA: transposase, partial [Patescibacteria group bacterium]
SGETLVNIITYCLNPSHYHLLLEQIVDGGITLFMRKLGTGYTNYFNLKHERSGHLFQGAFKAKHVTSNDYFLWLSAYINGNPEIHQTEKAEKYLWSSYREYLGRDDSGICDSQLILDQFKDINDYKKFVKMAIKKSVKIRQEPEEYFL